MASTKQEQKVKKDDDILAQITQLIERGKKSWSKEEIDALAALAQGKSVAVPTKKEKESLVPKEMEPTAVALEATYSLVARLDAAGKSQVLKMLDLPGWVREGVSSKEMMS